MLSNREIAVLMWGGAVLLVLASQREMRESLGGVLRALFAPQIVSVLLIVGLYIAACVWALAAVHVWASENLKTTLLWAMTFAFVTTLSLNRIKDENIFYRETVRDTVSATAILLFVAEAYALPLVVELLLFPTAFILSAVGHLANRKPETRVVGTFATILLALIGTAYLVNGIWGAFVHRDEFATFATFRDFLIPVILSIAFLPVVYALLRYMSLERLLQGMRYGLSDKKLRRSALWQALLNFGLNEDYLNRWRREVQKRRPQSKADLVAIVRMLKTSRSRETAPPAVDPNDGWSPYAARTYLAESGFMPGDYHEISGTWHADTPLMELGGDIRSLPNNIAYYVEGNEHAARSLRVRINVNSRSHAANVEERFRAEAITLTEAALGNEAVAQVQHQLATGAIFTIQVGDRIVRTTFEEFRVGDPPGYTRSFIIELPTVEPATERLENV